MNDTLRPALLCALLFFAAIIAGCATIPSGNSDAADVAEALFRDGDLRGAAVAFVDAANSDRRARDQLLLRAAEAWRENGDRDAVANVIKQIDPRRLKGDAPLRLSLLRAEIALDAGDNAGVLSQLATEPGKASRNLRARHYELRGRALLADNPFAAAAEFARLDGLLDGAQRRENTRRIRSTLAKVGDEPLRRAAERLTAGDPLRAFAARAITSRGLSLPASLRDAPTPRQNANRPHNGQARIALLLPLSGQLRAVGIPVRDGFMAARFNTGDRVADVHLFDTGETPESAIDAYRRAVEDGATQVVGPLTRDSVSAVLSERDLPVPVLALNRGAGPLPPGQMSFALSPEDEAVAVARLLEQRGLRRVLVVAAPEELAQRSVEAFRVRHLQLDGEVMAVATLPASGVDYRSALRTAQSGAGLPTGAPSDLRVAFDPGVDAVFIAVRPEQARLLVPQLKLAGLINVPTIGTSMLHAVDDTSRQDRELDDIEFTELPWLLDDVPGLPSRSSLRAQLDSASGNTARLFAFGMDAWRLLLVQDALFDADLPLPGATGGLSIDAFGEVRSEPALARFRSGVARPSETGTLRPE